MIKKALVAVEYVFLENTPESIYECQKFLQGGRLDNISCKMAEDAWEQYIKIVRMRNGILYGRTLFGFDKYIVKDQLGNFNPHDPNEFSKIYRTINL